jgi:hypothetical protein
MAKVIPTFTIVNNRLRAAPFQEARTGEAETGSKERKAGKEKGTK